MAKMKCAPIMDMQAIKYASERFEADPDCGAPPIMWDDVTNTFVDMS